MKRALRILIPIIMILAVLGCTAWYLLVYDAAFTRDVLLWQARSFDASGYHKAATWLYDLAYFQSSHDDSVAIELSEQYRTLGNYTKAERTLSNAISDGGSAELYSALCRLYVEQDKLLDAVTMLDSITDPTVKAELDAQRPAAPVLTPEPGFYSQYITVSALDDQHTLYLSTDGAYPTTQKDLYDAPVTLPGGETVIYCVAVDDSGLVSPLTVSGYTVGGVIEQVSFADSAMEAAIREAAGVSADKVLFTDALWAITEFTVPEGVSVYSDLSYLTYLKSLTVSGAPAGQLSGIAGMTQLESLTLSGCSLSEDDLSAIGSLSNLKHLTAQKCGITTVAALSGMTGLTHLDLSGNTVRNIQALSGMSGLVELNLSGNALTDLSSLSSLEALKKLDVSYNSLTSLQPIAAISGLQTLNASHNQIAATDGMGSLTALTELNLAHNAITGIGSLSGCTAMVTLDVSNNTLADIAATAAMPALTTLSFAHNQVTALPAFKADCALVSIDGSYNLLENLDALKGLPQLNTVLVDYNEKLSSLKPLDSCGVLIQVNCYGTKVSDVSFLTDKSIIVNFDPTV